MNRKILLFALIFTLCIYQAVAQIGNPHVNITMDEVVYRNTTYAEDFFLTESTTFCYINGTLNVTNPGAETIYDIYLQFSNTEKMTSNFTHVSSSKFGNQTYGEPNTTIIIHIPELRQGNYSTFRYNVNCSDAEPPLNIETNYTNPDHGFNRKVLSGYNWTVNQSIINQNYLELNITNINITIESFYVIWNDTTFNFSLEELYEVEDYDNVHENDTSYRWWWQPNGGELAYNQKMNISYRVRAPYSVPFTATYKAIVETMTYQSNFLISNISLDFINVSADINISFEKRISQPADDVENHNVTWEIRPLINTPANITYDLNKVTLWVTENLDPTNKTQDTDWGLLEVNYTGTPLKEINLTTSWGNSSYFWYFNYTDGKNSSYPPPVVWIQPEWLITNNYGQILNYSTTRSGEDIYIKYIYVVHGYWLEVSKNVTNIGEDQYKINTYVENIGNGWTPAYTYVTVYDFVPNDFAVWDMTQGGCPSTQCQNLSVGSPGADYYGMSYRWNIPWKGGRNSSLGPRNGPDATVPGNYSWNVSYKVNGSGPYRVTDLYIVGLDPLRVDGAGASPIIAVMTGLQTYTKEIIYVGIVALLIVINVTNLVLTNRINKQLEGSKENIK